MTINGTVIGKLIAALDEDLRKKVLTLLVVGNKLNHAKARISAASVDTVEVRFEFVDSSSSVAFAPTYLIAFVDIRVRSRT